MGPRTDQALRRRFRALTAAAGGGVGHENWKNKKWSDLIICFLGDLDPNQWFFDVYIYIQIYKNGALAMSQKCGEFSLIFFHLFHGFCVLIRNEQPKNDQYQYETSWETSGLMTVDVFVGWRGPTLGRVMGSHSLAKLLQLSCAAAILCVSGVRPNANLFDII